MTRTQKRTGTRFRRVAVTCALIGALVGVVPAAANAVTAYSTVGIIGGNQVKTQALLHYQYNYAWARTKLTVDPTTYGWGARGRLFTSNNALACEGGIWWGDSNTYIIYGESCGKFGIASYYSYGVVYKSGGGAWYTFKSPVRSTS
jgi:hypothetical protein